MQATIPITRLPSSGVSQAVRARCLAGVLDSLTFRRSHQLRTLLQWLVERSLKGGIPPTELEIARTVLHRADFDPQADSVVRKEVSRLRAKLNRYYLSEGAHDDAVLRVAAGYRVEWSPHGPSPLPGRRCVVVLPFRHSPGLEADSFHLHDRIQLQAGKTGNFEMVALTTALAYAAQRADVRTISSDCGADWVVEGSLRRCGARLQATIWVVEGATGRARGAGRVIDGAVESIAKAVTDWLASF